MHDKGRRGDASVAWNNRRGGSCWRLSLKPTFLLFWLTFPLTKQSSNSHSRRKKREKLTQKFLETATVGHEGGIIGGQSSADQRPNFFTPGNTHIVTPTISYPLCLRPSQPFVTCPGFSCTAPSHSVQTTAWCHSYTQTHISSLETTVQSHRPREQHHGNATSQWQHLRTASGRCSSWPI